MAIQHSGLAQITARAGVLRAGTGRAGAAPPAYEMKPNPGDTGAWSYANMGVTLNALYVASSESAVGNGNPVVGWVDSSGGGHHFAAEAAGPLYIADGGTTFNHKPVLRFVSLNTRALVAIAPFVAADWIPGPATIFMVVHFTQVVDPNPLWVQSGGAGRNAVNYRTAGWNRLVGTFYDGATTDITFAANLDWMPSPPSILLWMWDGLNGYLGINSLATADLAVTGALGALLTADPLWIGRDFAANYAKMDLAEIVVCNGVVPQATRYLVAQYLSQKYDIPCHNPYTSPPGPTPPGGQILWDRSQPNTTYEGNPDDTVSTWVTGRY